MKTSTVIITVLLILVLGAAALVAVAILTYPGDDAAQHYDYEGGAYVAEIGGGQATLPSDTQNYNIHGLLSYIEYGDNRVYLLGSMHVGRPEFFPLADAVEQAMRRANAFAFEYDLTESTTLEGIMMMLAMMALPEGEVLATYLPPDAHAHLVGILSTFDYIDYEDVQEMNPTFIEMMMMQLEVAPALGVYEEHSIDMYVFEFAMAQGAEILGLVSMEHQLYALLNPPHDVMVSSVLNWPDKNTQITETRRLVNAYAAQDIGALRSMVSAVGINVTNLAELHMLSETARRTSEFAAEIDRLLRETYEPTTFFVTIGIAHLLHDQGNAIYLLGNKGHAVNELWR